MDEKVCVERYKALTEKIENNTARINRIEKENTILHEMNLNIGKIASEMEHLRKDVDEHGIEIKLLREKPYQDWDKTKGVIATALITTIIVATISNLDLFIKMLGG